MTIQLSSYKLMLYATGATFSLLILVFGILFMCGLPKHRNRYFGIRTTVTMKSEKAWRYAHDLSGKIFSVCGAILCAITAVLLFKKPGKYDFIAAVLLPVLDMTVILATITYVQDKIKNTFF